MPKIIAVDFDNTLSIGEYKYPACGVFNKELAHYIVSEQLNGAIIILNTCRVGIALVNAISFCRLNGLCFDYVNENSIEAIELMNGDCRKIFANEYIDDRNVFNKDWNIYKKEIINE